MTKIEKKLATAIATGALLLNTALPAFAGITIELSGNGSDSQNEAEVEVNQVTSVTQTNTANISNNVKAEAETGENDASRNTGGSVSIDTGDAKTEVKVTNEVNSNVADVQCCDASIDVLIEGNGDNSTNTVDIDYPDDGAGSNGTFVTQTNTAKIYNNVEAESSTGDNDAKRNTGGDVSITTGNATTKVDLLTMANSNWAQVSSNGNGGPSITARILGNGADSDNEIELEYDAATVVDQYNYAKVKNHVHAEAETGENDASRNTGGTVSIDTGDASTTVEVDNMINFNWADVDCGCLLDVLAKIAGNGDNSDNDIVAELEGGLFVEQANACKRPHHVGQVDLLGGDHHYYKPCLDNDVEAESETGDNDAKRNTGDPGVDPSIETGNADTEVVIENSGNSNVYGAGAPDFEFPEWLGGGFSINISLDLSALLALLGLA